MMEKIGQRELAEILDSYGISGVFYDTSKWVTPDSTIYIFSYKKDAKKKADGYIDDNHYWTKASTGDICMLSAVDELKV